jgi:hypothetical protein
MNHPARYTRKIDPRLGLIGFCGFFGFFGFVTCLAEHIFFPFVFFSFFGFFGLYYEGKMSSTLMDERFLENKLRADRKAYTICFYISFVSLMLTTTTEPAWAWIGGIMGLSASEMKLMFLTIALALGFGLAAFLSQYLLYFYDHEECDESEL